MANFKIYIRLFKEGSSFALQALRVNRLRTLLSLLGVTIGIFLIISVFTLVDSLERSIRTSFETLGDDSIFIEKMPWGPESGDEEYAWWKYMQRPQVTYSEMKKLKSRLNSAKHVTFFSATQKSLKSGRNSAENVVVVAASEGYDSFISVDIDRGRNFTLSELESNRRICILGHDVAEMLFGTEDAIGKTLKIGGYKATVVGTLEKEGASVIGNNRDEWTIIPVEFGRMLMNLKESDTQIAIKPKDLISFEAMENEALMAMRGIRMLRPEEEKNFAMNKSSMLNQGIEQIFGFLNVAGFIIGGFSILVGGFSIANIMFVSVRERTNIIGIQKALGAKKSFILYQFLFESVTLCLIGGIVGLIMIFVGSTVTSMITGFDLSMTWMNVLVGIGFSVGIGLVSGIIPASIAASMEPVEAIRSTA